MKTRSQTMLTVEEMTSNASFSSPARKRATADSHGKQKDSNTSTIVETAVDKFNSVNLHRHAHGEMNVKLHKDARKHPWWSKKRLVFYTYDTAPGYMQDNDCIHTGYRAHYTFNESWISLLHLHNEWSNVWTHLAPFFAYIGLIVNLWVTELHPNATLIDYWLVTLFLISASYTFLASSLFHLHLCVSEEVYITFGCLDYSGYALNIHCFGSSPLKTKQLFKNIGFNMWKCSEHCVLCIGMRSISAALVYFITSVCESRWNCRTDVQFLENTSLPAGKSSNILHKRSSELGSDNILFVENQRYKYASDSKFQFHGAWPCNNDCIVYRWGYHICVTCT